MIKKATVYKCEKCGNIIESLWNGQCSVKCCDVEMAPQEPNTFEGAKEKHIPIIERNGNKVTVMVGSNLHPMAKDHYILFVEVLDGNNVHRHDFVEGDSSPVAEFLVEGNAIAARAYCNKHGFWQS